MVNPGIGIICLVPNPEPGRNSTASPEVLKTHSIQLPHLSPSSGS
jgi:hypothetical protein